MFPPRSRNSGRMREEHDIGHHHHHHHHHHHKLPEPNDSSGDERDESGLQKLEDWWRHKRGHHDKRSHSDPTPKLKKHEKVRRDPAENRGGSSGDDEASDLSGPEDDQPSEPDSDLDQGQPRSEHLLSLFCSHTSRIKPLTLESLPSPLPDNSGLSARLTSNADNATGRTSAPPPGSGWRTPSDEQTGGELSLRFFVRSRLALGGLTHPRLPLNSRNRFRFRSVRTGSTSSVRISRSRDRSHARSASSAAAGLVHSSESAALPASAGSASLPTLHESAVLTAGASACLPVQDGSDLPFATAFDRGPRTRERPLDPSPFGSSSSDERCASTGSTSSFGHSEHRNIRPEHAVGVAAAAAGAAWPIRPYAFDLDLAAAGAFSPRRVHPAAGVVRLSRHGFRSAAGVVAVRLCRRDDLPPCAVCHDDVSGNVVSACSSSSSYAFVLGGGTGVVSRLACSFRSDSDESALGRTVHERFDMATAG